MVLLRAEVQDRAAPQAELDADLDDDGEVAEGERLERRDGGADGALAAVGLRIGDAVLAALREPLSRG